MDIKLKVGNRIRELITNKLSQEELAAKAGLDRTYINSVIRGKRNISIINIEKIAKALDFTVKEFFTSEHFNNKKTK